MMHLTHSWEYIGDHVKDGNRYLKFACHCGGYKIVERTVTTDESGTHE